MRKITIAICLAPQLRAWAKDAAKNNGLSVSSYISLLIAQAKSEAER